MTAKKEPILAPDLKEISNWAKFERAVDVAVKSGPKHKRDEKISLHNATEKEKDTDKVRK